MRFKCRQCKRKVELVISADGSLTAICPEHGVIWKDQGDDEE
jgi:flavorubredoxin